MHIAQGFMDQAQRQPEKSAVVVHTPRMASRCYGDLLSAAQRVAGTIADLLNPNARSNASLPLQPLQNHSCVGLLLPNSVEFLEIFLGVAMAGGVAIVFDPKWTQNQIQQVLQSYPIDLLFADATLLPQLVDLPNDLPGDLEQELRSWIKNRPPTPNSGGARIQSPPELGDLGGKSVPPGEIVVLRFTSLEQENPIALDRFDRVTHYSEWRNSDRKAGTPIGSMTDTDLFYVGFTSGTTGQPKGVMRSHRSWVNSFSASQIEFGINASDRILVPGSLVHSLSLYAALECLNTSATLYLLPQFSARAALDCLETDAITTIVAVPTWLRTIARAAIRREQTYSSPRTVIAGGCRLESDLRTQLRQVFPQADILEYFGALELSFICLASSREPVPPASVGRPFQSVTVSIRRQDGAEAAVGEVGWIGVKSSLLSSGYFSEDDATGYRVIAGWATVGDLGWRDAAGYLYLVGREQEMLVTGGMNVYPAEIEAALHCLAEVEEAAVFGIPDADRGQVLAAAIRWTGEALTRSELQQRLQSVLPQSKCPRSVFTVDRFPRTHSGKIIRAALREQLAEGQPPPGQP